MKLAQKAAPGITKEALNQELNVDLAAALEMEALAQVNCMQTADLREAHRAFVEKRENRFQGK